MGTIHLELSADLQALIDRQIADGHTPSAQSFLTEAARRYAEDLAHERELIEIAAQGIADIEAGRFVTIESHSDGEAWMAERLANVRARLTQDECPTA